SRKTSQSNTELVSSTALGRPASGAGSRGVGTGFRLPRSARVGAGGLGRRSRQLATPGSPEYNARLFGRLRCALWRASPPSEHQADSSPALVRPRGSTRGKVDESASCAFRTGLIVSSRARVPSKKITSNFKREQVTHANHQPTRASRSPDRDHEVEIAGDAGKPAAPWRVHPRVHHHAEEAELGTSQGRQGAPDQPDGGHLLHRW